VVKELNRRRGGGKRGGGGGGGGRMGGKELLKPDVRKQGEGKEGCEKARGGTWKKWPLFGVNTFGKAEEFSIANEGGKNMAARI